MVQNGAAEAVEGSNEKIPMPSGLVELSFRFREIPRFARNDSLKPAQRAIPPQTPPARRRQVRSDGVKTPKRRRARGRPNASLTMPGDSNNRMSYIPLAQHCRQSEAIAGEEIP